MTGKETVSLFVYCNAVRDAAHLIGTGKVVCLRIVSGGNGIESDIIVFNIFLCFIAINVSTEKNDFNTFFFAESILIQLDNLDVSDFLGYSDIQLFLSLVPPF